MNHDSRPSARQFELVTKFVKSVKTAADLNEVEAVLGEATRAFDFDHFALIQRLSHRNSTGPIQLTDYPRDWIECVLRNEFFVHDPVLMASERSVAAFAWDELDEIIALTPHHARFMDAARSQGLGDGFTVPIHVPGEAAGLCSFVVSRTRTLPRGALPSMQYVACFAFEAARRLARLPGPGQRPRLTQRQLECVVLAARGKSNWVVGELLGLSQQTVHKYIEEAKRRYGVSSRTELVVRALFDGELSFRDVLE
jgi:LuxR family quorum-sensing system transcriptional regulator CciR